MRCQLDCLVATAACCDDDPICAPTSCHSGNNGLPVFSGHCGADAKTAREVDSSDIDVDSNHLTSGATQQLGYQLPNQTETDNDDDISERDVRLSYRLDGNGADGREGSIVEINLVRYADAQIRGYAHVLGMVRVPCPSARNAHPRTKSGDSLARLHHDPRAAVPQWIRPFQRPHRLGVSGGQAFASGDLQNLPDLIRASQRLSDQTFGTEAYALAFGPRTNQGAHVAHEYSAATRKRDWNILYREQTSTLVLQYLFQSNYRLKLLYIS